MVWLCRANALRIRERNRYKVQAKYFIHEWSLCARPYIHTFSSWARLYPILTSYDPIIIIIAIIINHFRVEETEVQTIYLPIDLSIYLSIIYLPTYLSMCPAHSKLSNRLCTYILSSFSVQICVSLCGVHIVMSLWRCQMLSLLFPLE